jgi:hypothetical protein
MISEEGFFVAKLLCSLRVDFDIAKEQQVKTSSTVGMLVQFKNQKIILKKSRPGLNPWPK